MVRLVGWVAGGRVRVMEVGWVVVIGEGEGVWEWADWLTAAMSVVKRTRIILRRWLMIGFRLSFDLSVGGVGVGENKKNWIMC